MPLPPDKGATMEFTAADSAGIVLAVLLAVPLFLLPGLLVARLTGALDFRPADAAGRLAVGLLVAHAAVPLAAALGLRWLGARPTTLLLLAAAVAAFHLERHTLSAVATRRSIALIAAVTAAAVLLNADFDIGGRLYQSLLATDMVKHAAFVRALAEHGAPPPDPFFLRETPASYYYFYYAPAALVLNAGFGLVDQRAAFVGIQVWTVIATVALVLTVMERSALMPHNRRGLLTATLILMSTAGLQLILVLMNWLKGGMWREQSGWLNDMVNSFFISAIWVPHHVSAFIAACVALMLLVAMAGNRDSERAPSLCWRSIALAGIALASMAGQSVWISFGAVAIVGVWSALLAFERRWRALVAICLSGALSLALAAPHLADLLAFRDVSGAPVALRIRYFNLAESLTGMLGGGETLIGLALLPLNYAFEAAIFIVGTVAFWQRHNLREIHANELARLLTIGCVVTLVIGSFVASTIGNNDLGWRVVMFAQLAALVWSVNVFAPVWQRSARSAGSARMFAIVPRAALPLLAFGLLAGAHDLLMLRVHHAVNASHPEAERIDPAAAHDLRRAYAWLSANVPRSTVVQHNPDVARATGFGLYGHNRVAVSDRHNAALFGASAIDASRRLMNLAPVFDGCADVAAIGRALKDARVDMLLVASPDRAWSNHAAWAATARPVYENSHVRLYSAADLTEAPRRISGAGAGAGPRAAGAH